MRGAAPHCMSWEVIVNVRRNWQKPTLSWCLLFVLWFSINLRRKRSFFFFFKNWSQQGGSVDPMCLWSSLLSCLSVGFVYVTRQHPRVWDRVPTLTFYVKHPTLPSSKLETANCWHSVCWVGMGKCLWTCHKEMFAQHGSACVSSSTLEERQGDCRKCKVRQGREIQHPGGEAEGLLQV